MLIKRYRQIRIANIFTWRSFYANPGGTLIGSGVGTMMQPTGKAIGFA